MTKTIKKDCVNCKNYYEFETYYEYCKVKDQKNGKAFSEQIKSNEAENCKAFEEKG